MEYRKILLIVLTIIICFSGYSTVSAQTIPAGTTVDQYSDAQIKQLLQSAQQQGLSDAQIVQQAQARGLSADQAARLQQRISNIRKTQGGATSVDTIQNQPRALNYIPDSSNTNKPNIDIFSSLKPKIFGADLFRNSNIGANPNLNIATPVNYIVGPTDQLNINVYGNSLANWQLKVSPEGNINIPGVGPLNVAGKTIEQATASIKSKLAANNYAIGKGTSVEVNLGNIRSISVVVIGEVLRPNTYVLSSLSTVFGALNKAGGPSDNGTFRQIDIIRNGKIFRHLDLYDFFNKRRSKR